MPPVKSKLIKKKELPVSVDSDDIEKQSIISKEKISLSEPIIEDVEIEPIVKPVVKPIVNPITPKQKSVPKDKKSNIAKDTNDTKDTNLVKTNQQIIKKESHKTSTMLTKSENMVDMFDDNDIDYRIVMMNYDFTKNITLPRITKYEKALLIGKRAKQIEEGANPNIKVTPGQSVIEIAEEELRQRKIPLYIKRPIGNTFEYWKPKDMEVVMD
jgi:DNA-directed RNA polymerase subunit K/omega